MKIRKEEALYIIIINIIISVFISSFLILYFPKKNMNKIVLLLSFIFFFFNFSMPLLIPLDIYYSISPDKAKGKKTNVDDILILNYGINCIVLNLINKLIFTFILSYLQSGEFQKKYKIIDGIKSLLIELGILIIIGTALFDFLNEFNIFNLLLLIYEVYNMVFVYINIGVTIIKLPKKKYLLSNINMALKYYQFKTHEKNLEIKKK